MRPGRPKLAKSVLKAKLLRVRVTGKQLAVMEKAAEREHLDLSAWVRMILLKEAEKVNVEGS